MELLSFSKKEKIILLCSVVFLGVLSGVKLLGVVPHQQIQIEGVGPKTHHVNESVSEDGITVVVHNVNTSVFEENGTSYITYIIDLSFQNTQTKTYSVLPVFQTYLKDSDGKTYSMIPSDEVTQPFIAGALPPFDIRRGEISFVVPADSTPYDLYIDTGWDNQEVIIFDLL